MSKGMSKGMSKPTIREPWEYKRNELVEIARQIGAFLEDDDFSDQCLAWRSVKIDNYYLLVFVDIDGEVFFLVNGSSKINDLISVQKGAILWRWFIKLWEMVRDDLNSQELATNCYVVPECGDDFYERRVRFFWLLGFDFTENKGSKMFLDN